MTHDEVMQLLQDKIDGLSFKNVRDDITRFIRDDKVLDIWSAGYLSDLIKKIKFAE